MSYRNILVGLEDRPAARKALLEGIRLAHASGTGLHAVIVEKPPHQEEWVPVEFTPSERGSHLLDEVIETGRKGGVRIEGHILFGDTVLILDEFIKKRGIDLVVIGRPRHSALASALAGCTAYGLIRTAACPVLVVT